jgi:DNA-directed RNA polymerase subunit RPC12/RpoP
MNYCCPRCGEQFETLTAYTFHKLLICRGRGV